MPMPTLNTMSGRRVLVLLTMLCMLAAGSLQAKPKQELDYLTLAAVLIRDGHYDRAQQALLSVDTEDEDLERPRYHLLSGLVALHQQRFAAAKEALRAAIAAGHEDPTVYLYLARAHFGLEEFAEVVAALERAGEAGRGSADVLVMKATAYWRQNKRDAAWTALETGLSAFPRDPRFYRMKVTYLIELGVYRGAAELIPAFLARAQDPAGSGVRLAAALRREGQADLAARVLEPLRLQHRGHREVTLELAHAYMDLGQMNAAGDVLADGAAFDPEMAAEAAHAYRSAGRLFRALTLNASVPDRGRKLKQRLAILVDLEAFELAAGSEAALHRNRLLEDGELRYALAFALFKNGEFGRTEYHLSQLTDGELFRKAVQLRRAMEACRERKWQCLASDTL